MLDFKDIQGLNVIIDFIKNSETGVLEAWEDGRVIA